ncbi:MAG TPA: M56 family metallopeptidase [Clostridia bacterium]|nr:M56 family metallopeptidase [Clostridia bacterium]
MDRIISRFVPMMLSLSVSGTILALIIISLKVVVKQAVSKTFMYYVWILVLLRLVIPFGLWDGLFRTTSSGFYALTQVNNDFHGNSQYPGAYPHGEEISTDMENIRPSYSPASQSISNEPMDITPNKIPWVNSSRAFIFFIWLMGALITFSYSFISYLLFTKKTIQTGNVPPKRINDIFRSLHNFRNLGLICSKYAKTPMQIGIIKPYIVIPQGRYEESEIELKHILRHEIIHYRRGDLVYKWLVHLVASLHWFNPFMIIIRKSVEDACELACDEEVIRNMLARQRMEYGEVLISQSHESGISAGRLAASLYYPKNNLKERILGIKTYRPRSLATNILALILAIALTGCAFSLGPEVPDGDTNPSAKDFILQEEGSKTDDNGYPMDDIPNLTTYLSGSDNSLRLKPINIESKMPMFELPDKSPLLYPDSKGQIYKVEPVDVRANIQTAEHTAHELWDNVTQMYSESSLNLNPNILAFVSDTAGAHYGSYRESIRIDGRDPLNMEYLGYDNAFLDNPALSPLPGQDSLKRSDNEFISIAKNFASRIPETADYIVDVPRVHKVLMEYYRSNLEGDVQIPDVTAVCWDHWVDGLRVYNDGLYISFLGNNDRPLSLSLRKHLLSKIDGENPDFLLRADEALHCINYVRSNRELWSTNPPGMAIFSNRQEIVSVNPILSNVFSNKGDVFVPTWEFIIFPFPHPDSDCFSMDILVNALTGEVYIGANGRLYSPPLEM